MPLSGKRYLIKKDIQDEEKEVPLCHSKLSEMILQK